MKELLERVVVQLDRLDEKLDDVDRTLIKQEENLREHMRRTELLESQHEMLRSEIHTELTPIKSHINQVKGISKFLAISIPILGGILGVVYKFIIM
jgi:uncharacterized protein YoxC